MVVVDLPMTYILKTLMKYLVRKRHRRQIVTKISHLKVLQFVKQKIVTTVYTNGQAQKTLDTVKIACKT